MKGFIIAGVLWLVTSVTCMGSFLSGNTGMVLPMFFAFYLISVIAAYVAGRSVDLQSPIRPRGASPARAARPAPVAAARSSNGIRRLQKEDEFA